MRISLHFDGQMVEQELLAKKKVMTKLQRVAGGEKRKLESLKSTLADLEPEVYFTKSMASLRDFPKPVRLQ